VCLFARVLVSVEIGEQGWKLYFFGE